MSKKQQTRVELLVESIAVEKQILIEICDDLAAARDTGDKKNAKQAKKDLEAQILTINKDKDSILAELSASEELEKNTQEQILIFQKVRKDRCIFYQKDVLL